MSGQTTPKKDTRTAEQKIKDKQAAFVRIVQPRVNKALKALRLIGSCASANYLYSPEQAAAIVDVLVKGVAGVENAYAKKTAKSAEFSL